MERRKTIGNVNILDLRKATEASVGEYEAIGNVNMAFYTPETAHLLHRLSIGNLNCSAEVSLDTDLELIMGPLEIGSDHFANLAAPLGLMVMGPVTLAPDLRPEDLERGLALAMVMGPVTVPEPLAAVFQSKAKLVMGPVRTYPILDRIHKGNLTLDAAYLDGLSAGTELVVVGSVTIPAGIQAGAVRRKLTKLHVTGSTTCFEETAAEVHSILTGTSGGVHVIPKGFRVIDREVKLTRDLLESLSERKLYFTRVLVIDEDVDAPLFSQKIDGLACVRTIICPESLKGALAKVCDLLRTEVIFYEGSLWLIDGQTKLLPGRFDYLDGRATLIVDGVLEVAPDVSPETLASRLAKVYLHGVIECTPEQQAAIESRLEVSEGAFQPVGEEPKEGKDRIGNANVLTL